MDFFLYFSFYLKFTCIDLLKQANNNVCLVINVHFRCFFYSTTLVAIFVYRVILLFVFFFTWSSNNNFNHLCCQLMVCIALFILAFVLCFSCL